MIVVDTNVIAYLLLGGDQNPHARAVYVADSEWVAPVLWRSEFRNVLALYMRRRALVFQDALALQRTAERLFQGREYHPASDDVLTLVGQSPCSAYDCEFVALAKALRLELVTSDAEVLKAFPTIAVPLKKFLPR